MQHDGYVKTLQWQSPGPVSGSPFSFIGRSLNCSSKSRPGLSVGHARVQALSLRHIVGFEQPSRSLQDRVGQKVAFKRCTYAVGMWSLSAVIALCFF